MWVELTSKLMYKLWAVEWIRERSSDQNSFLYLEECCCFRDDASDPDLRFQRKRNRFDLWKVHLLVVGQQSLQTLCLLADTERKVQKNGIIPVQTLWSTGQMLTFVFSTITFFLRFPLSLCTAFISCTSLSTNVCWAANSERITLTLLSPWKKLEFRSNSSFISL